MIKKLGLLVVSAFVVAAIAVAPACTKKEDTVETAPAAAPAPEAAPAPAPEAAPAAPEAAPAAPAAK